MNYPLIPYWLIIFFCLGFSNPLSYAEAIPVKTTEQSSSVLIKKEKKAKHRKYKNRKQFSKKPTQSEGGIVTSLYLTFSILILLPALIILGIILVGVGFPSLLFFYLGLGFILFGNLSALTAFGLWILLGTNLLGAITLLVLNLLLFSSLLLWVLIAGLFVLAIFTLVWALIIRKQNKAFRNATTDQE